MNDELLEILENVQDALELGGQAADRLESELLEDPLAFAERYKEHLTTADLRLLGAVPITGTKS